MRACVVIIVVACSLVAAINSYYPSENRVASFHSVGISAVSFMYLTDDSPLSLELFITTGTCRTAPAPYGPYVSTRSFTSYTGESTTYDQRYAHSTLDYAYHMDHCAFFYDSWPDATNDIYRRSKNGYVMIEAEGYDTLSSDVRLTYGHPDPSYYPASGAGNGCDVVEGPGGSPFFQCPLPSIDGDWTLHAWVVGLRPLREGPLVTDIVARMENSGGPWTSYRIPESFTEHATIAFEQVINFGCGSSCVYGSCTLGPDCLCDPGYMGSTCSQRDVCTIGSGLPASSFCLGTVTWQLDNTLDVAAADAQAKSYYDVLSNATDCASCLSTAKAYLCGKFFPACTAGKGAGVCNAACQRFYSSCAPYLPDVLPLNVTSCGYSTGNCTDPSSTLGSCGACPISATNHRVCSGRGRCHAATGLCQCQTGFYGVDCSFGVLPPSSAPAPTPLPPSIVTGAFSTVARDATYAYLATWDSTTSNTWYALPNAGVDRYDPLPRKSIAAAVFNGTDLYVAGPIGKDKEIKMNNDPWDASADDHFVFRYRAGVWTRLPIYLDGMFISKMYIDGDLLWIVGRFFAANDKKSRDGKSIGAYNVVTGEWTQLPDFFASIAKRLDAGMNLQNHDQEFVDVVVQTGWYLVGSYYDMVNNGSHVILSGDFYQFGWCASIRHLIAFDLTTGIWSPIDKPNTIRAVPRVINPTRRLMEVDANETLAAGETGHGPSRRLLDEISYSETSFSCVYGSYTQSLLSFPLHEAINGPVYAMISANVRGSTILVLGGLFKNAGGLTRGATRVVMYNTSSGNWLSMGQQSLPGTYIVRAIEATPDLSWVFFAGKFPSSALVKWKNAAAPVFQVVPGLGGTVRTLKLINGDLYVAGNMTNSTTGVPLSIAIYRNATLPSAYWDGNPPTMASAMGNITAILPVPGSNLVLFAGDFIGAGEAARWSDLRTGAGETNMIAFWNNERFANMKLGYTNFQPARVKWENPFFNSMLALTSRINAVVTYNGNTYVGGQFNENDHFPLCPGCCNLARWNSTHGWSAVEMTATYSGEGIQYRAFTMCGGYGDPSTTYVSGLAMFDDILIVTGRFYDYGAGWLGGFFPLNLTDGRELLWNDPEFCYPYGLNMMGSLVLGNSVWVFGKFQDSSPPRDATYEDIILMLYSNVTHRFTTQHLTGTNGCSKFVKTGINVGNFMYFGGSIIQCTINSVKVDNAVRLDLANGAFHNMGGNGIPGGLVHKMAYDESTNTIYVGGRFSDPTLRMNNIQGYDVESDCWFPMGDGVDDEVHDVVIYQGTLYIAGKFKATLYDNRWLGGLARWDGSAWQPVHTGIFNGDILRLLFVPPVENATYAPNCNASFAPAPTAMVAGQSVTLTISSRDLWSRYSSTPGLTFNMSLPGVVNTTVRDLTATQRRYVVAFVPTLSGVFQRTMVTLDGAEILGSPFAVAVQPAATSSVGSICYNFTSSVAGAVTVIRVQMRDRFKNNRTTGGDPVTLTVTRGGVPVNMPLVDTGTGAYIASAVLTTTGTHHVTATLLVAGVQTPLGTGGAWDFELVPPGLTPAQSTIDLLPPALVAGVRTTLVVSLRDQFGNLISPGDMTSRINATLRDVDGDEYLLSTLVVRTAPAVYNVTLYAETAATNVSLMLRVMGLPLAASPYAYDILPNPHTSAAASTVAGLSDGTTVTVRDAAFPFSITARDAYGNEVDHAGDVFTVVPLNGDTDTSAPIDVQHTTGGSYVASMTLTSAGVYTVSITLGGMPVAASPYTIQALPLSATDPSRITFTVPPHPIAGAVVRPVLALRDRLGNVRLIDSVVDTVSVSLVSGVTGALVPFNLTRDDVYAAYTLSFCVNVTGPVVASAMVNSAAVPSSPYTMAIEAGPIDPDATTADGDGLVSGVAFVEANFTIHARDRLGNAASAGGSLASQFQIAIGSSSGEAAQILSANETGPGELLVTYVASEGGVLAVSVLVVGSNAGISGSPFRVTIYGNCQPGAFSPSPLDECKACAPGSYTAIYGQESCTSCPPATTSIVGATGLLACTCPAGYYEPNKQLGVSCVPCPTGATCAGGVDGPVAAPGFYSAPGNIFMACDPPSSCTGGDACDVGYTGRLCGACIEGYFRSSGACYPCSNGGGRLFAFLFFSVLTCVLLVWFQATTHTTTKFAVLSVGFNAVQIGALYNNLSMNWSPAARDLFKAMSVFNFNLELIAPECSLWSSGNAFVSRWIAEIFLPLYFALIFVIIYFVLVAWIRFANTPRADAFVEAHKQWFVRLPYKAPLRWRIRNRIVKAFRVGETTPKLMWWAVVRAAFQLLVLGYLPLVYESLSYLNCTTGPDGVSAVRADPTLICFTASYNARLVLLVLAGMIYGLGIPAAVVYVLYRKRKLLDPIRFEIDYGFIVSRFLPQFYQWELLLLSRKLLVVLSVLFFTVFPAMRAGGAMFVLFIAYCLHHKYSPFRKGIHNKVEAATIICTMTVFLWGIFFQYRPAGTDALSDFFILTTLIIDALIVLGACAYDLWQTAREERRAEVEFAMMMEGQSADLTSQHMKSGSVVDGFTESQIVEEPQSVDTLGLEANPVFTAEPQMASVMYNNSTDSQNTSVNEIVKKSKALMVALPPAITVPVDQGPRRGAVSKQI